MFINCPACRALVATDPATDQPPERCPRCGVALREPASTGTAAPLNVVQNAVPATAPDDDAHDPVTTSRPATSTECLSAEIEAQMQPVSRDNGRGTGVGHDSRPATADAIDGQTSGDDDDGDAAAAQQGPPATAAAESHPAAATSGAGAPVPAQPVRSIASLLQRLVHPVDTRVYAPPVPVEPDTADIQTTQSSEDNKVDDADADANARTPPSAPTDSDGGDDRRAADSPMSGHGSRTTHDGADSALSSTAGAVDAMATAGRVAAPAEPTIASRTASLVEAKALDPQTAAAIGAPLADAPAAAAVRRDGEGSRVIAPVGSPVGGSQPSPAVRTLPSFAHARRSRPVVNGWTTAAALAVLSVALLVQLALADRERLAADAAWRPRIEALCAALRCSVPPWREPAALEILSRDVRAVAGSPGLLRISAVFRNDARWAQPLPQVRVTLTDVNGGRVAARDFAPRDYAAAAAIADGLAPGQTASMDIGVIEPGRRSVAFDFLLH